MAYLILVEKGQGHQRSNLAHVELAEVFSGFLAVNVYDYLYSVIHGL